MCAAGTNLKPVWFPSIYSYIVQSWIIHTQEHENYGFVSNLCHWQLLMKKMYHKSFTIQAMFSMQLVFKLFNLEISIFK